MSCKVFDDNCPDCKPAILNPQTGKVEPTNSLIMQATLYVWMNKLTFKERQTCHRVWCLCSQTPDDLLVQHTLSGLVQKAMSVVNGVWNETTLAERHSFERVCYWKSDLPADLHNMKEVSDRIQKALVETM